MLDSYYGMSAIFVSPWKGSSVKTSLFHELTFYGGKVSMHYLCTKRRLIAFLDFKGMQIHC